MAPSFVTSLLLPLRPKHRISATRKKPQATRVMCNTPGQTNTHNPTQTSMQTATSAHPPSRDALAQTADIHPHPRTATHNALRTLPGDTQGKRRAKGKETELAKLLPHILVIHSGGTFGMCVEDAQCMHPTSPKPRLRPGAYLADVLQTFPELTSTANIEVISPMNLDSSHMGPAHWVTIATLLHEHRAEYDGFVIIHGTDTMNFTGSALSLMLAGFAKPVVLTGSQLPMSFPRSDARQNFVDAVAVACAGRLQEVAICFGGCLLRANRAVKYSSSAYSAYKSPTYPHLATLGVDIEWDTRALYTCTQVYRPRLKLEASVARIPIVPGVDPNVAYGDMVGRGLRGVVIESFGVGNVPDCAGSAWGEWLAAQRKKGLRIYLASQCVTGPLNPELYCSGVDLAEEGACGRRMTSDTAVIKMMLCLAYPDLRISYPLAGEL